MQPAVRKISVSAESSPADRLEVEFAKDIWDVRNIPGVRYNAHRSDHLLNFTRVPVVFRPAVKRYIRFLLTMCSHSHCCEHLRHIRAFLVYFMEKYPGVLDFHNISVDDIDTYLHHIKSTNNFYNRQKGAKHIWTAISAIERFFRYLQRTNNPLAFSMPVEKVIWPEHLGKAPQPRRNGIRYIPETVLHQLEQHIEHLPPAYLSVVILLRASGWRISDVLNLRYDTCLEPTTGGWNLVGDIQKTKVLNHKVPITNEVAAIVQAQCDLVKEHYPESVNPQRYLFPSPNRRRKGRPITADNVRDALNHLAETYRICGADGNIFHFTNHAFRHTKAVELINNGMGLTYVQRWLAHLSPEMTLKYAEILASTLRRQWEHAMARGAVRIGLDGIPQAVDPEMLDQGNELELEHVRATLDSRRLSNGYCFKHRKFDCPAAEIPCYNCQMFVTTPDFLSQLQRERQETIQLIDIGEAAGRAHWVEANRRKLGKLERIIITLEQGQIHQPMGKAKREYTPQERQKQAAKPEQEYQQ